MKISGLYGRVSTQKQEKEETIESQVDEIKTRACADGNSLPQENIFLDDGWSGEMLARPRLDALRDSIKDKKLEVLYVYDLGRLSRTFLNQLILIEEIKNSGVELISLHDINAETGEEVLAQRVMGIFHDYERVKIGERMRRGKEYKARKGLIVNGPAAYGYDYVAKTKEVEAHWVVNEEEAGVVRKIFVWVADERLTVRGVIRRLYELEILPKKARRGAIWSNGPICRLLRNEAYIGKAYYNKNYAVVPEHPQNKEYYKKVKKSSRKQRIKDEWIPIPVPAILEESIFNRVQEQLKLNQKFNKRNRKTKCLLPQKVFCVCGRHRIIEGVREHRYYRCSDRVYRFPLPRECKASGVNAFHLDDMVWEKVSTQFTNGDWIREQARIWSKSEAKNLEYSQDNVTSLDKLKKKFDEEEDRYVKAYGVGAITLEQLQEKTKGVRQRKAVIESKIRTTIDIKPKRVVDINQIDNLPEKFNKMLQSLSYEEKQLFLRDILEKVVVDGTKVSVKGLIPVERQAQNNEFRTESWDSRSAKRGEEHAI